MSFDIGDEVTVRPRNPQGARGHSVAWLGTKARALLSCPLIYLNITILERSRYVHRN